MLLRSKSQNRRRMMGMINEVNVLSMVDKAKLRVIHYCDMVWKTVLSSRGSL